MYLIVSSVKSVASAASAHLIKMDVETRAAEKAVLLAKMDALASEISGLRRNVMGAPCVLPSVESIHHVEVTSTRKNGAFVAIPGFGSGFIHASEYSRRVVQLQRQTDGGAGGLYAILPPDPPMMLDASVVQEASATLMTGEAAMGSLLPLGRRVWASVTGTAGGQVHLSCRDVDQQSGEPLDYLPAIPAAGELVRGVVAHVHSLEGNDGQPDQGWAILELPDFDGTLFPSGSGGGTTDEHTLERRLSCSGFLHRSDTHLHHPGGGAGGPPMLQRGDVLTVRVLHCADDGDGSPVGKDGVPRRRIRLQAGEPWVAGSRRYWNKREKGKAKRLPPALADMCAAAAGPSGRRLSGISKKKKAKAKKQRKGKQGGRSGRHELMRLVNDERESPAEGEWYVEHARQRAQREPEHEAAEPGEQPIFHLPDFGPPESPGSRSPQSLAGEQMLLPDAGAPGESMAMVD
jgi:hypothetical protein